jgi:hypothetical protein
MINIANKSSAQPCRLANDSDRRVREQATILFQNITTGSQEITFTLKGLGTERLVNMLQAAMSRNDPETVEHVSAIPIPYHISLIFHRAFER